MFFLAWSDYVRTATEVGILLYRFTTIYTVNHVLFTATVGRQMIGFEPSLPCFVLCFRFFSVLVWVGEWVNGCLSILLFTAAAGGLEMSGFEPSLLLFCVFFRFVFRSFFLVGEGG